MLVGGCPEQSWQQPVAWLALARFATDKTRVSLCFFL
jgi:hypothetical protein